MSRQLVNLLGVTKSVSPLKVKASTQTASCNPNPNNIASGLVLVPTPAPVAKTMTVAPKKKLLCDMCKKEPGIIPGVMDMYKRYCPACYKRVEKRGLQIVEMLQTMESVEEWEFSDAEENERFFVDRRGRIYTVRYQKGRLSEKPVSLRWTNPFDDAETNTIYFMKGKSNAI